MPWLDRPASVQTRIEVVLHRLDDPMTLAITNPASKATTVYDVWEARLLYVFDAAAGRWEVVSVKPFGYRRGARHGVPIEIQGSSQQLRDLAKHYAPDWIPEPSQPKLRLPAEAVYDEALAAVDGALTTLPSMTRSMREKLLGVIATHAANPYRGE
ncbi:hypothetical protein SEA_VALENTINIPUFF_43 [Microbacterium phage ValentiniPuff]|uniref:Uncharacterized protein n=1 Tax=Microbacterium phage ValentiniPuff TaxID=2315705 RepID=A0A386KQR2_9CAUD|nr:hypothetical protein SEA_VALENTINIPUFF_43 [Microbacterium phage ValentiniPuff]